MDLEIRPDEPTDRRQLEDLVVISGFSGAGKSSALSVFDDAGYFCVDNLPPGMIRSLAQLFLHDGSKVQRACVVCDPRAGDYFDELVAVLDQLDTEAITNRVLFLEADQTDLLTRYKQTRRRHPLARTGNVADGIELERQRLAAIRERADTVIDTTGMNANALRRKVSAEMLTAGIGGRLAVSFISFGHKHGPARDADLVLDVRFLDNPHWNPKLRAQTGLDPRVIDYIAADGRLQQFYDRLIPLLDFLLPQYIAEGKSHLVIGIGCTGGRHRSVAVAQTLAAHYHNNKHLTVEASHRDIQHPPIRQ